MVGGKGQCLDLAAFDGAKYRADQWDDRKVDHTAHQVLEVGGQAAVGRVQATRACILQCLFGHQVIQRADAGRAKAEWLFGLPGPCRKLFQRVHRQVLAHGNRDRGMAHQGRQPHVIRLVLGRGQAQRRVDQLQWGARQDGVPVRLRIRRLEHTQCATHAHHVLDDDGLAKHFSHPLPDSSAEHIRAAAGRKGDDHADGLGRVGLGGCRGGHRHADKQRTAKTNQ